MQTPWAVEGTRHINQTQDYNVRRICRTGEYFLYLKKHLTPDLTPYLEEKKLKLERGR